MQLDLMLVFERFADDSAALLYPINILRNYARLQVGKALHTALSDHAQIWCTTKNYCPMKFRADTFYSPPLWQARTPLIALFDVDMLPSNTLFTDLRRPGRAKW